MIAHRVSTIRNADKFLVIDDGRLVESGSYEGLMRRRGTFYELVRAQEQDQGAPTAAQAASVPAQRAGIR